MQEEQLTIDGYLPKWNIYIGAYWLISHPDISQVPILAIWPLW